MEEQIKKFLKKIKDGLTLNGRKRVFEDNRKLSSDLMKEPADPEEYTKEFLISPVLELFSLQKLPEKHFTTATGRRKVDYRLINDNENHFLLEAKPLNSNLYDKSKDGGINQIKGLFLLAEVKDKYSFGIATSSSIRISKSFVT